MSTPVQQHHRVLPGESSAQLMSTEDGSFYVVKFRNNPQHRRVLINELICYQILSHLDLATPGWDIIDVQAEVIRKSPALLLGRGKQRWQGEPGLQFGSKLPVDPARHAIYDYVPLTMVRELINLDQVLGVLAFDRWVGNADQRQAVFFRGSAKRWVLPDCHVRIGGRDITPRMLVYAANFIDNGSAFNGDRWSLIVPPDQGLFWRPEVYESVRGLSDFDPWLSRIESLPPAVLEEALRCVPDEWFDEDRGRLEGLLDQLYLRRTQLTEILCEMRDALPDVFPKWSSRYSDATAASRGDRVRRAGMSGAARGSGVVGLGPEIGR